MSVYAFGTNQQWVCSVAVNATRRGCSDHLPFCYLLLSSRNAPSDDYARAPHKLRLYSCAFGVAPVAKMAVAFGLASYQSCRCFGKVFGLGILKEIRRSNKPMMGVVPLPMPLLLPSQTEPLGPVFAETGWDSSE